MQRGRARLLGWAALALALSTFTTPHAGLYFHHHAGGDHAHVHLDGEDHDHDQDHDAVEPHGRHDHEHHSRLARAAANGPAIEAPDDDGTGHWHSQDFFQRAVSPAVFVVQHSEAVGVVQDPPERAPVDRPALPGRARGPPHTA